MALSLLGSSSTQHSTQKGKTWKMGTQVLWGGDPDKNVQIGLVNDVLGLSRIMDHIQQVRDPQAARAAPWVLMEKN